MNSYRSLVAWQLAHELCVRTLRACDDAYHPRSRALFDQLRRAVISVEANIVEGYALDTPAYRSKHLRIAFGSAAEAEILLIDAAELTYLPADFVNEIQPVVDRTQKTLRGFLPR